MTEISDELLCLFTAQVERRDGSYVVELPDSEASMGTVEEGGVYRVGVFSRSTGADSARSTGGGAPREVPDPPVEEGDTREVEIEDIGEQGDGVARIERGYIVFVPGTDLGDRVTIEITDVRRNFAFADVIEGPR